MPRDLVALETKPDLTLPTMAGLAWLLRHPSAWPTDHTWDFGSFLMSAEAYRSLGHQAAPECGTVGCAGGIAWLTWGGEAPPPFSISVAMDHMFDIEPQVAFNIFVRGVDTFPRPTADHVAGRIDDHLAGRPIRR